MSNNFLTSVYFSKKNCILPLRTLRGFIKRLGSGEIMENTNQNATITIDDKRYIISDLSDIAKSQVANIRFSDEKILQLQNELTI